MYLHVYVSSALFHWLQVFGDVTVEEGLLICVEVVAAEKEGQYRSVIFLGSVRYESLRRVYDARVS